MATVMALVLAIQRPSVPEVISIIDPEAKAAALLDRYAPLTIFLEMLPSFLTWPFLSPVIRAQIYSSLLEFALIILQISSSVKLRFLPPLPSLLFWQTIYQLKPPRASQLSQVLPVCRPQHQLFHLDIYTSNFHAISH